MSNLKTILKSFNFKEELNPKFWIKKDSTYILRPQIREKLLQIAYEFLDSLDVDVIISDVTFTGSLCNFNWSDYSDVDLHLKTDYNQFHKDDVPLYEELFDLKSTIFSEKHDITMYGYDVELYVEDENQKRTENAGVYSILQNEWVVEPKKEKKTVDKTSVIKKSKSWMKQIDTAIDLAKEESLDDAKKILKRIKTKIAKYRTCGLQKGGEFSVENLVFKVLRRSGYIQKIKNLKNELINKNLSIKEQSIEDPELETSEKAEYVEPDVKKFYEELEGINSNIDQQQSGSYTYQKDVETFQIALDILGYKLPRYGVDGKFGPETAKAVNDFKKDNGLKLTESIKRKRLVEADIAGIDELVYNPVTGKDGTIGYGFDSEKRIPSISWKNHDTHLHIGFTNRDVAIAVMDKAKELGLSPAENLYTGKVNPVHTNNSFHYRVFDGEPAVSAGVDIWDVNGKKRDELNKLIQWIYDNYENKSTQKTPVVGYGGTNIGSYKIGSLFNAASQALDSFKKSNSFVSPEMAKKLVEKLKEKNITSSDIQKYTKIQMDFNDVVAKSDEEFYKEILRKIGAPTSESNLRFMYAWGKAESSRAKFNPISTTWDLDADSNISPFNCKNFKNKEVEPPVNNKCKPGFSSLVKNYSTPQYGIEATVKTLLSSKQDYSCIVNGLKNELPPDEIAKCESLEKWGTGDLVGKVLKSEKFTVPKIQGFS